MEEKTNTLEQGTQEQVKADEIAIDEKGEVVFLDSEQPQETDESNTSSGETVENKKQDNATDGERLDKKGLYSLDEFKEVAAQGFERLDPKRIPEELIPYYKSMQADYTRKTQQVAQQRRELEQLQKEVQEQVKLAEMQANYQVPKDVLLTAMQEAKQKAMLHLGVDDEYSPEFQQAQAYFLNETINNYKQQMAAQQRLQAAENYLRKLDGENFQRIEQQALYLIENGLTAKELRVLEAAKTKGDPLPLLNLYERARRLVFGTEQTKETPQLTTQEVTKQAKPTAKPPIIEDAGGEVQQQAKKPAYRATDFAGKNTAEQTRMLIEMGII